MKPERNYIAMTFHEEQARKYLDFAERDSRGLDYWCGTKGFSRKEQDRICEEVYKLRQERKGLK